MKIDYTYLIFKNDFKHRNWIDWIASHIILGPPPYRLKGSISIDSQGITFSGYDTYLKENVEFLIKKNEMTQLYYGYDETFSTFQTRGMGLSWAPIRIKFNSISFDDKEEDTLYLVSKFNGEFSENQELFNELKDWLS